MASHRVQNMKRVYIYENEGQERKLLSRENFLQKKSFVHRVKIFEEKKETSFKRSNHLHRFSLFRFFILYPVNELSKGGVEYP